LAVISTSFIKKTYSLFVEVNEKNEIVNIKSRNDKKNKIKIYPAAILHKRVTLVKAAGFHLVTLLCAPFDAKTGCPIVIKYPTNIILQSYKNFKAEIRFRDNKWGLFVGPNRFTRMHLVAKKPLGLLIGVRRIELSYRKVSKKESYLGIMDSQSYRNNSFARLLLNGSTRDKLAFNLR